MLKTKSGMSLQHSLQLRLGKGIVAAEREMLSQGEAVRDAARGLVPIDTQALHDSGQVEGPIRDGAQSTVLIYFGDDDVINWSHGRATSTYAWDQHENESYRHMNGGQPHFLSEPFENMKADIAEKVAGAFMRGLYE